VGSISNRTHQSITSPSSLNSLVASTMATAERDVGHNQMSQNACVILDSVVTND
jgi:hypothetical protein